MDLGLNEAVTGVICGSLAAVAGMTVLSRLRHRAAELRMIRSRSVCRLCGHVFLADHSGKLTHCPACDCLNLQSRNGHLG
jgi:predicted Zn-ribbon and HTH transcriptional regulator